MSSLCQERRWTCSLQRKKCDWLTTGKDAMFSLLPDRDVMPSLLLEELVCWPNCWQARCVDVVSSLSAARGDMMSSLPAGKRWYPHCCQWRCDRLTVGKLAVAVSLLAGKRWCPHCCQKRRCYRMLTHEQETCSWKTIRRLSYTKTGPRTRTRCA